MTVSFYNILRHKHIFNSNTGWKVSKYGPEITPYLDTFMQCNRHLRWSVFGKSCWWKPLTFFVKRPILDACQGSEYLSVKDLCFLFIRFCFYSISQVYIFHPVFKKYCHFCRLLLDLSNPKNGGQILFPHYKSFFLCNIIFYLLP